MEYSIVKIKSGLKGSDKIRVCKFGITNGRLLFTYAGMDEEAKKALKNIDAIQATFLKCPVVDEVNQTELFDIFPKNNNVTYTKTGIIIDGTRLDSRYNWRVYLSEDENLAAVINEEYSETYSLDILYGGTKPYSVLYNEPDRKDISIAVMPIRVGIDYVPVLFDVLSNIAKGIENKLAI